LIRRLFTILIAFVAVLFAYGRIDERDATASSIGDIPLVRETKLVRARVAAGATLASLLRAEGVAVAEVGDVVSRAARVFDVRRLRAERPYRIEKALTGALERFEYEIDGDRFLRVSRGKDFELVADVLPIPKTRHVVVVGGEINRDASSLVAAMDAAGETIDLTLAMADIFGGEIDFSTELQPGDTFQLTVEKQYRNGSSAGSAEEFAGYGPIVAAEFVNHGRRLRAVRYQPEGAAPAYFDEHGVSMKRFFLASPLKFQPIVTSGFSSGRFHPILKEVRAHLGVDYKAPIGSPVVAVADGVVVSAGMSGGSGNMVHLRHSQGFETEYLHLSSIAVRAGAHVRQGELVGRVGMTGLATGPHLDYRVKKNGAFINPVIAHRAMPPAEPIPQAQMAAFVSARDRAFEQMSSIETAQ
jgi:murein DD-endopeptidase MepM/ murein hydrolase activator NlpD